MKSNFSKGLKIFLLFGFLCAIGNVYSQSESRKSMFTLDPDLEKEARKERSFGRKLWGDKVENNVTFMPFGYHTDRVKNADAPIVQYFWYTSISYNSFELAGFKNSFGDASLALFYKRKIILTQRFSVHIGGGLIYGYHGRLQNTPGVPFANTILITGPLTPVLGVSFDYRITNKVSLHLSGAPLIILYGFRFRL
tara:strand:+ start:5797 stop:6381 length:585 start_codon:yes stop_codon:yes gene_type:complete